MGLMGEATSMDSGQAENREPIRALLEGLREQSAEAWADLYDHFAPGIHWFAVTLLLGDTETARDVVVETMADAARRIDRFDPRRSSLSTWLYGIARRRVQMEIRHQRRQKAVPAWAQVSMDAVAETSEGGDLAADAAARVDAQRKVGVLATALTDTEMELLTLSCIDELSTREIGEVVGRSEQVVNSMLYRARQKARERLAADET
jgi:RNA polymerase sigma-70 factor (ECF subfamily)